MKHSWETEQGLVVRTGRYETRIVLHPSCSETPLLKATFSTSYPGASRISLTLESPSGRVLYRGHMDHDHGLHGDLTSRELQQRLWSQFWRFIGAK